MTASHYILKKDINAKAKSGLSIPRRFVVRMKNYSTGEEYFKAYLREAEAIVTLNIDDAEPVL